MDAQYIYLYDLPKDKISSIKVAECFKEKAGVALGDSQRPQIKYDITKPFYSAMVNIKDAEQFKTACEMMRYFEIDGKQCRGLPFDRQLLGSNKEKLFSQNVFVRNIPKDVTHEQLHKIFSQIGPIKSLKISLNGDHTSRGYGFICFENAESATKALASKDLGEMDVIKFEPKDNKSNLRKLMNNIYVKNIPHSYSNDDVRKMFEPFGHIFSLVMKSNEIGQFAFVCYDDPKGVNKEYGPQCAQKAIEGLNNKEISDGDKKVNLVVRNALKRAEREVEKLRETIRYKNSKKRCNLYVKNFPNNYKKDQLETLFKPFGEIENIRLDKGQSGNAFAFVCFKQPTDAANAKQHLHNHTLEGKQLVIYYYEIKELRQLQNEQAKDKADWEKYQAQQTGGFQWNELTNLPNLSQILTTLMQVIHAHEQQNAQNNQQDRQMYKGGERRRGPNQRHPGQQHHGNYQNQGQNMPGGGMGQMNPQQMMQLQQNMAGGLPQPPAAGMPQGRMPQQMNQMPQAPQGMPMPAPGAMPPAPMGGAPQARMAGGVEGDYLAKTSRILPAIQERNTKYQEQVGQLIYDYILQMVGQELAPKITGMLIDLPIPQIRAYLGNYGALQAKVQEAQAHLMQSEKK